nr:Chain A, Lactotransferrin [Bos taurus]
KFGKNKSR